MDRLKSLRPEVVDILVSKGTEAPNTGKYCMVPIEAGSYVCQRCGEALFNGADQFASKCGWPSFDAALAGKVEEQSDVDGVRTEIICAACASHLGHVFRGENYTAKQTRYCVNSLAIEWVAGTGVSCVQQAIFAAGCFWGVQQKFADLDGVLLTEVGYCGGELADPSYEQVCVGHTGHYEAVRVVYDPGQVSYSELLVHFFSIHNATQVDGQGPDIGQQYQSCVFVENEEQEKMLQESIKKRECNGVKIATKCLPQQVFWAAEGYHQHYYKR